MGTESMQHKAGEELERLLQIRGQVLELLAKADLLAVVIRRKSSE